MVRCVIFIGLFFIFYPYLSFSKVYEIPEIKVKANIIKPAKEKGESLFTGVKIKNFKGTSSQNSVYNAISLLPSVNLDSDDPFGIGDKRMRIRGTSDYFVGLTIEGIPEYGIMPIGPRDYIFDIENLESIKVFSGSIPGNLMSGSGNRGGAIELKVSPPKEKFAITFNQYLGSFSFSKTYLRIDSGKFKTGTKFFISSSYLDSDKWKGEGKLGPRKNVFFNLAQNFGKNIKLKFFVNYNSFNRHLFKGLVYSQAKNLHKYFYHDYNKRLTGNPIIDWNYYGNNKFKGINRDYFGIFDLKITKNFNFAFKPYYSKENNSKYQGIGSKNFGIVLKKINSSKRYGFTTELSLNFKKIDFIMGYWFEKERFNPIIKKYQPKNDLIFKGYGWYTKSSTRGKIYSPYFKVSSNYKNFLFQAGLKYFYYKEPAKSGFWYKNGKFVYDSNISIGSEDYDVWLPSIGIGYRFSKNFEIDLSYSKKYQRPYAYGPLSSFYFQHYKTFISKNITLQNLFDNLDMEKVHSFDLIFRNKLGNLSLVTDFFYQKHKNILVSLNDPRVNLAYFQNDGEAKSYGLEIISNYKFSKYISGFLNGSFTKMEFSKNISRGNKIFKVDGKQFPDTPKYLIKSGFNYNFKNFQISPYITISSKRYGDALNNEKIPGYATVNLNVDYFYKNSTISLEVKNLFNKKHIGRIDTWDDSTGKATYYASYPFTAILKLKMSF